MMATVALQPAAAAASMMARVDRLDLLLGYLEEMHRNGNGNGNGDGNGNGNGNASPTTTASSSPSTPAAASGGGGGHHGLVSSDDDVDSCSSAASTPRGTASKKTSWRRPRPAKEVLEEAKAKGSLIDRIAFLEHRVLKMEEGMDLEITPAGGTDKVAASLQPRAMMMSKDDDDPSGISSNKTKNKKKKKAWLKSLVKSCVRGNLKTKG